MEKAKAIILASKWWADLLRSPSDSSSGYGVADAMLEIGRAKIPPPSESEIATFQACLEDAICGHLKNCIWDKFNPRRGDALRVISVDWNPDKCLSFALDKANINPLWLPPKTRMWISPDEIKVSENGNHYLLNIH